MSTMCKSVEFHSRAVIRAWCIAVAGGCGCASMCMHDLWPVHIAVAEPMMLKIGMQAAQHVS